MRTHFGLSFGLVLFALLGLAFVVWSRPLAASAQDENPAPPAPVIMAPAMPAAIAASGDFVYVLRGNTVYQLKAADLSVAAHTDLSAQPEAAPAAPGEKE